MTFSLSITESLYEHAETRHDYDDVVREADEVSAAYRCYLEWYHQADDMLYDGETTDVEVDLITQAIGEVLTPPQIAYSTDEWFPVSQWRSAASRYSSAVSRIREALLV